MLKTLLLIILIYMVYQYVIMPMFQGWIGNRDKQPEIHNEPEQSIGEINPSDIVDADYEEIDDNEGK